MSNLSYAGRAPTIGFRGAMTLPHELNLVETPSGLRIAQTIPSQVDARFERLELGSGSTKPPSVSYRLEVSLAATEQEASVQLFGSEPILHLKREAGAVDVALSIYVDNGHVEIVAMSGLAVVSVLYFPAEPLGPARINER